MASLVPERSMKVVSMFTQVGRNPGESPRRGGFTLIELLVVIAIIAILIALLFPAIQAIRERARSTQCANNLMQLGLAFANYASTHAVLPPGVVNAKGPILNAPAGYHHSWTVQILPYLGLETLHQHIDLDRGVYDLANQTVLNVTISTFICPSNSRRGPSNYAGCHHDAEAAIDSDNHGVLYLNSHVRLGEIPDGASHTILLGEYLSGAPSLGWASGTRSTLRNTGMTINIEDSPIAPAVPPLIPTFERDLAGVEGLTASGALPLEFVGGFSSNHPGGANFLFCDGSARFLKRTIEAATYHRLGNRADGEVVGDDAY